ncbi:transcriptional regulator, y4mF family [compost metagenome]
MDRNEALGVVLRKLREDKGLTQLVVADRASMSSTFVSQVENARKGLKVSTLFDLCDALGVRASDLMRKVEDEAAKRRPARSRIDKPR